MRIRIATITPESPAAHCGLHAGDEIRSIDDVTPRDVLDYARLAAEPGAVATLADGREIPAAGLSGARLDDAVFDGVQTCDNHCEFCFIYQLPAGLRRTLYLKDDDYRLSALYGNFTTLTRFTELDLERVIDEQISPLHVSVHATDPHLRAEMLRNAKGGVSLRWLRYALDAGIEVHAQVVACPGTNTGDILDATLAELLAGYSSLASVGVVPLGISRFNTEQGLRAPTSDDAAQIADSVAFWQEVARERLGRRFVFASDEVYLLAGLPFPAAETYEGFVQHENGIGMARALEADLTPQPGRAAGAPPWGYRPERLDDVERNRPRTADRVAILTGRYGARVLEPLLADLSPSGVEIVGVENRFFGGNTAVAGLLVGADLVDAARRLDADVEIVIPDVVLHEGRTLDEWTPARIAAESGRLLRVVSTDAAGLRVAVGA